MQPTQPSLSAWGRLYVAAVILCGAAAVVDSLYQLQIRSIGWNWFILALLTVLSGAATVRLPSVPATISISETFVITTVLLFGPAAGTLTVTLDVLTISLWLARKGHPHYRIAFNIFALPAALWVAATLLYAQPGMVPLGIAKTDVRMAHLLVPLTVFTLTYFLLNSWLIAIAIWFERKLPPFSIWKNNFAWLSLNYFGGASIAALLVSYTRNLDFAFLIFALPLLVVLYLAFSMAMGRIEDAHLHLAKLNSLYMSTIETLAMAIDAKDQVTHGHIRRVQTYAVGLAKALGVNEEAHIKAIEAASLLHDMGKLAVPEYILNKPGPLTPAEFEKMKLHASVGADILSAINFPYPVVPIVRHHHENWDGSGYPDGLSGAHIPIGARILSVVDCFDALTSDRPYRPKLADRDAIDILLERRGKMYDPLIVDRFLQVYRQIAPASHSDVTALPLKAISSSITESGGTHVITGGLEEISASTDEMLTLFELARSLGPSMRLADISDVIAKHIRRLIPCSTCVFYIYNSESDDLVAAHVSGEHSSLIVDSRIPKGQRLSGWVAATRRTIINSDPVLDLGESARAMSPRPRSCLSAVMDVDQTLVGVLTLYSGGAFASDHERVLEIVARQVAPILQAAIVFDRDRAHSLRDQLTGLPNVAQFKQIGESSGRLTSARPVSILLIDVDNMNSINSLRGRDTGDAVLGHIVQVARRTLRSADVLFRNDDDEFIAVLFSTAASTAVSISERLCLAIRDCRELGGINVTVSVGVATGPADGESLDLLLHVARRRASRTSGGPTASITEDTIH